MAYRPNYCPDYWLMKCEPSAFSIFDLQKAPQQTTSWEGVRNYQARNLLRDQFKVGDRAFYYHSNEDPSGIFGTMKVVRAGYPDHTAFTPKHKYYDPKSDPQNPTWFMVDVQLETIFPQPILLPAIKANKKLAKMMVVQQGSRLSIQPVKADEWEEILKMV